MPGAPEPDQNMLLENYLAVIAEVAVCIGTACPDVAAAHQEHLLRMRSRLAFASDEQTLAETRDAIENELRTYAERVRALGERRSDDLRRILKSFSQVTEVLAERSEAACQQLAHFSGQVREITNQVPWLNIRDALRESMEDAASRMDVLRLESQLAQAHVLEQIRVFEGRLAARNPQQVDMLTGLGNRAETEEQIRRRMEAGKTFTLLLYETDLEAMARGVGAAVADQVLVQAAARLSAQVRAHDFVGRWSANEFAIVMECGLENAEPRSRQIANWLTGTYTMSGGVADAPVEVEFSVRVVDPGEAEIASSADAESENAPLPA